MAEIINNAFVDPTAYDLDVANAPDLLTAIARFYEAKGLFTQKAIQGQLDEMKGDQKKMELINEKLAYYRAANAAQNGDTFTMSQTAYYEIAWSNNSAPNQNMAEDVNAAGEWTGNPCANGACAVRVRFGKPSDNDTKTNQAKLDTLKSQLDTMNNTSQLKMLSLNKYMDNLSTITTTAANSQKSVGDMNQGIAQKT